MERGVRFRVFWRIRIDLLGNSVDFGMACYFSYSIDRISVSCARLNIAIEF